MGDAFGVVYESDRAPFDCLNGSDQQSYTLFFPREVPFASARLGGLRGHAAGRPVPFREVAKNFGKPDLAGK